MAPGPNLAGCSCKWRFTETQPCSLVSVLSMPAFGLQRQSWDIVTDWMACKVWNISYLIFSRKVLLTPIPGSPVLIHMIHNWIIFPFSRRSFASEISHGFVSAADRIMGPKDIHALILQTHEDLLTLHSKRDFANMSKDTEMTLPTWGLIIKKIPIWEAGGSQSEWWWRP